MRCLRLRCTNWTVRSRYTVSGGGASVFLEHHEWNVHCKKDHGLETNARFRDGVLLAASTVPGSEDVFMHVIAVVRDWCGEPVFGICISRSCYPVFLPLTSALMTNLTSSSDHTNGQAVLAWTRFKTFGLVKYPSTASTKPVLHGHINYGPW